MKRIIRLTERDLTRLVKRVINEQMLLGNAGGLLSMPDTGYSVDIGTGYVDYGGCKTYKSSGELTLELFGKLRVVAGQTSQSDKTIQSWILRLNNSMKGIGASNDLSKVLSEIKTKEQMGSVLNAYNKKFGKTLWQDLSGEQTITWNTIWGIVKKFKSGISMNGCKEYRKVQNQVVA
jgi:hypothetical protein